MTLTAAIHSSAVSVNPPPLHLRVAVIGLWQQQQANVSVRISSIARFLWTVITAFAALRGSRALALRSVLGSSLFAILDRLRIEDAADDVVADAGQIAHASAAHKDDGMLLQVVALARDVCRHLDLVRQADAGHLAQGRVRL